MLQCDFILVGLCSSPHFLRAPKSAAIFIDVIVKAPILQIFMMLSGFTLLAMEHPLPFIKKMSIYRSFALRAILLLGQALVSVFVYQVRALATLRNSSCSFVFCRERTQLFIQ